MVPLRWSPQKIYPILHLTSRGYLKWVYPQVYHPHMSKRTPTRVGLNKQLRGMEPTIPRGAPFSQHFSGPAFWISKWNLSTNTGNSGGCGISCRTEGRIFWEKHMAVFFVWNNDNIWKKNLWKPKEIGMLKCRLIIFHYHHFDLSHNLVFPLSVLNWTKKAFNRPVQPQVRSLNLPNVLEARSSLDPEESQVLEKFQENYRKTHGFSWLGGWVSTQTIWKILYSQNGKTSPNK